MTAGTAERSDEASRRRRFVVDSGRRRALAHHPAHRQRPSPGASRARLAAPDPAAIVAELRATFGDAASLCIQGDDKGAPVSPAGDCDDHCPFCQFAAQAATLIAPDAPVPPVPRDNSFETLGAAPVTGALPVSPTKRSRARAPPSAV